MFNLAVTMLEGMGPCLGETFILLQLGTAMLVRMKIVPKQCPWVLLDPRVLLDPGIVDEG